MSLSIYSYLFFSHGYIFNAIYETIIQSLGNLSNILYFSCLLKTHLVKAFESFTDSNTIRLS